MYKRASQDNGKKNEQEVLQLHRVVYVTSDLVEVVVGFSYYFGLLLCSC